MKDIPEYAEMTPEDRKAAYEKFVRRQQVSPNHHPRVEERLTM
jgi:hypothetical protein